MLHEMVSKKYLPNKIIEQVIHKRTSVDQAISDPEHNYSAVEINVLN